MKNIAAVTAIFFLGFLGAPFSLYAQHPSIIHCEEELLGYLNSSERVGVYVGSFDPFQDGHHEVVSVALDEQERPLDWVLVIANNENRHKPGRSPLQQRLEMIRRSFQKGDRVLIPSLHVDDIAPLLAGRVTRVGLIGSDGILRHLETGRPPKLDADEWFGTQRQSDPPIPPGLRELGGRPFRAAAPGSLHRQRFSSTMVRGYLAQHPELYQGTTSPSRDELPLSPAALQFIIDHRLYAPIDALLSRIEHHLKAVRLPLIFPGEDLELINLNSSGLSGLSGDILFLVKSKATGQKKMIIKAFVAPDRVERYRKELLGINRFAQATEGSSLIGGAKALFAEDAGEYCLLGQSIAPGVEIRDSLLRASRSTAEQKTLNAANRATGKALAALHRIASAPIPAGEDFSAFQDKLTAQLRELSDNASLLPSTDIPGLIRLINRLYEDFRHAPGHYTYVHGDANPGNFFYESDQSPITMIDVGRFPEFQTEDQPRSASGSLPMPHGLPAYEFHQYISSLRLFQIRMNLDPVLVAAAVTSFEIGYRHGDSAMNLASDRYFEAFWMIRTLTSRLKAFREAQRIAGEGLTTTPPSAAWNSLKEAERMLASRIEAWRSSPCAQEEGCR